jgi:hypothetical protein
MGIKLDTLLTETNNIDSQEASLVTKNTTEIPKSIPDIEAILNEWTWRCEKGYPDFNNPSDMYKLQEVLDEMGINLPFDKIKISEADLNRPTVTTNETSLKEGLVCLFFDCFKDTALRSHILHLQELKRSKIGKGVDITNEPELSDALSGISNVFKSNKANYGAGNSAVTNLDSYVKWVWYTGNELDTLNNAISAANTIHSTITKRGQVIRNKTFDDIRELAVSLIKQDYDIKMFPDNWCPGDIYIVSTPNSDKKALQAKSLNIDPKNNLNSNFQKNSKIIAVSLKEQKAQAGKASTFADTVFVKDYKSNIPKEQLLGTKDSDTVRVSASISRYTDYLEGNLKAKRKQSYINAISKEGKIHKSVNTILKAAGMNQYKSSDIVGISKPKSEKDFYAKNKVIFDALNTAVAKLRDRFNNEKEVKNTTISFVNSRNVFIKNLKDLNVDVDAVKSATFASEIQKAAGDDSVKVLSMKRSTYELASKIIYKWKTDIESLSPAYKKISDTTNPFVALTAFAIAEAGINPSFWKVIGRDKGITGEAHFFDSNDIVDIDTKTSSIKLVDSPGQAGFYLRYVTTVGTKRYNTQLTFRFANDTIRIEVEKFTAV